MDNYLISFLTITLSARALVPGNQSLALLASQAMSAPGAWARSAVDGDTGRIYLPEASRVLVLDVDGRQVGEVPGIRGAHTVTLAPDLGIGICSSGRTNTLAVFNLTTLAVEKVLRTTGGEPEGVVFDPASRRIFAFNARGRNATAFDAFGGATSGSIPLGGKPGPAAADGRGRIFVLLRDTRELLELDSWRLAVTRRLPLAGVEEPRALALDPVRQRLFVAGEGGRLAILDTDSRRLLEVLPVNGDPGGLLCDPASGVAYLGHPDGTLSMVQPGRDGAYRVVCGAPAMRE